MVRGSIAHLLLEQLDLSRPAVPDAAAVQLAAQMSEAEVGAEDIADLQELVRAAIEGEVLARALAARRVRREEGFAFVLDDVPFNGYVDLLAEEADGTTLVVDYKTNPVAGVDLEALTEADYGLQRRIYALAALRAGAPAVEVVHLYLERPAEPVTARYGAADAPALEAELRAGASPLMRGEFPVAPVPHLGLCAGCPGRAALLLAPARAHRARAGRVSVRGLPGRTKVLSTNTFVRHAATGARRPGWAPVNRNSSGSRGPHAPRPA